MNPFFTLVQALVEHPQPQSSIHFVSGEQVPHSITYGALRDRALGLLHHFQQSGMGINDQVILITQRNEAFVEGFWAAILGGIVAVPLSFGLSDEHKWKLFRIVKQLDRPWIMLDQAHVVRLEKFAAAHHLENEWEALKTRLFVIEHIPKFSGHGKVATVDEEQTAIIQFSSGTTSDPKGVVLSHKNIATNIAAIVGASKMAKDDSTFSWMPLTHDMGLIGFHLTPLFLGIDQYIMPTELFIRRPLLWLERIAQQGITITCSPNFGYKHCLKAWSIHHVELADLSKIRLILNGAEPISVPLAQQFLSTYGPFGLKPETMFTVYGLAEASLAVAFPEVGKPFKYVRIGRESLSMGARVKVDREGLPFVAEGKPVAGCQLRIVSPTGDVLPSNHIGRIEIKGDNVTKGYLNLDGVNAQVFRDGWLDTGDLGFIDEDGDLIVTGRAKDIMFINGQNYYPHDIEIIAEEGMGIEKGKIAVCGIRKTDDVEDQPVLFVIHRGSEEEFYDKVMPLKRLINETVGIEVAEVVPITKMPKTTSGKIQRYILGAQYLDGEFDQVMGKLHKHAQSLSNGHMVDVVAGVEQTLKNICDELIPEKKVQPDDNIFEIGTTSLLLAQLHQRIEETYPGAVEVTDFFDYPTLRQLAAFINNRS